MLLISQNITNFNFPIPENAVFRINLAWINELNDLNELLKKYPTRQIFLDLPINRTKPPNNRYTFEELIEILKNNLNIKYLAISNVNDSNDIKEYVGDVPNHISIVPKIESKMGVEKIDDICNQLNYNEKIIMLDHDDLFSDLLKNDVPYENFSKFVNQLIDYCNKNKIQLLRTIGVIFANDHKEVKNYIK